MNDPLISVIVPIYNVEKYVKKCLDSLKNQTMKQIEVICIDDGSTDESGMIAEEYKNEEGWPRFRIIHTENRGLSAARNRGIDEAKAEWIMFVDSDDWVESEFCRVPYEAAIENQADMVIFQADNWRKGKKRKNTKTKKGPIGIVDEFTVHACGRTNAWNKIYRNSLFGYIRYPVGFVYEDIATTHRIVHQAKRFFFLPDCLYHHEYRDDSISHTKIVSYKKDEYEASRKRSRDLLLFGFPEEKIRYSSCISALRFLSVLEPSDNEMYKNVMEYVNSIDHIPKSLSKKMKVALAIWKINPALFHLLCRVTGRIKNE